MIIDITRFVDFMRWFNFLNHSFNKGDEWTKAVINDGKEDQIKAYLIKIPNNLGTLFSKPLKVEIVLADTFRRKIKQWMISYEKDTKKVDVHEVYRILKELLNEEGT